MTTKKYLEQIERIEQLVLNKRAEEDRIRELCGSISIHTDGERVQSSNISDPTGRVGTELAEISRQIDLWMNKRKRIISQIDMIEDKDVYLILTYRYVRHMSIFDICDVMERSERQVIRMLNKSCDYFEQRYGKTYLTDENCQ